MAISRLVIAMKMPNYDKEWIICKSIKRTAPKTLVVKFENKDA
jgi:hypothetical protein